MERIIVSILFVLASQLSWSQEAEVRGVIDKFFQSMYKGDTATLRTLFIPAAQLMTYGYDAKGNPRAKAETLADFMKGVSRIGDEVLEERLTGWQIMIDEGMASVWTPYEFYFDNKFSHCGVNSFQLIKVQYQWKISMITDTRRKENCVVNDKIKHEVDSLVNAWHHAAAVADEDAFFGRMSADGIYIGTDPTERWLRDELKEWSKKYFDQNTAWAFKPLSRNITIAPGNQLVWFDELLDTWMGVCRSTGVMELREGEWKIVHYHLSVAMPNDLLDAYKGLLEKK